MFHLLSHMKGLRRQALLAPLFKMLEATMELCLPLVVAAIIDRGIGNQDKPFLLWMVLVMVLFGVLGLAFAVTAQYFSARVAVMFTGRLRHALFAHIESLSYRELDTLGTSTLITRMTSDMNQIQNGMNLTLRLLLRSPFIVFGAMIMAFTIDVKSALLFAVIIPLLSLVVFGIMLISIPLYKRVQLRLDRVLSTTRQNLTGVRVLRAFCMEEEQREAFGERNAALTADQKLVGRISALMNPLTYVIINAGIIALVYTGAIRVNNGLLSQGQVVALYNYMSQILVELIKLANLIISITKAVACGNRVQSIFELRSSLEQPTTDGSDAIDRGMDAQTNAPSLSTTSPEKHTTSSGKCPDAQTPLVQFRNVSLQYHGAAEEMLSDINLQLFPGERLGIIGGTGAGKSSLVQLIPRFYDATSGEVLVSGQNVRDYTLDDLRAQIGIVPQKAVLFSGTIRSNLQWGKPDATDEELWEALRLAQAEAFVRDREEGLDAPVAQGGKNFSGGQRQRLTIARALVGQPSILILDDSSSALDYATDAALRQALKTLPYRPGVLLVSQRTASLMHCDRILVLDDGKAVGLGTHEELLSSCAIYEEIYRSQFSAEEATAEEGGVAR